ncbi:MAG: LCP family protein [Clostridium sp.]|jgi:LCP family protein required for cell wall assembly
MNYEDDELERMRARRERRRNMSASHGRQNAAGNTGNRGHRGAEESNSRSRGSGTAFHSSYSGPKNGSSSGGRKNSHARTRMAERKRKKRIIALEVAAILLLLVIGGCWYVYERTFGALQKIEFNEDEVKNLNLTEEQLAGMKGYMTVACFGVDSRKSDGLVDGQLRVGKGTNADVNIIANINLETGEIRLVSVFRDSYLNINDKNSYNKINAAYAQGGPEQAVKALNKNLGLNITQYATFNWKAVADAINLLGGVDITISENEFSWINSYITETVKETGIGSTQLTHAGEVHLDGVQAVAYGRLRLGDTDYARTERQRIILSKAFEKAKTADWATLNCILYTVMPQLATNITITDLVPLARNITSYHLSETAGFPNARGEMDIGKVGDCVVPQTLESNVKELHAFLYGEENYVVPDNVRQYSNHIAEVTGLTKEGKPVGHVPVDQGVNASVYVKGKAKRAAEKAAAEAAEEAARASREAQSTEESSIDESAESSTGESGTFDESMLDPDEEWLDDWSEDWYEDWEDGQDGPGSEGPGSQSKPTRPGSGPSGSQESTAPSDKTNNSGKHNGETASGKPGMESSAGSQTPSTTAAARPDGNGPAGGVQSPVATREDAGNSANASGNGSPGPGTF